MKKIILIIGMCLLFLTGCTEKNIDGSLEDIMTSLYKGIDEEKLPALERTKLTKENIENSLFISDIDFSEGLISEPLISSIPHSVVLVRLKNSKDSKKVVEEIKENVNPRKWICVEAKNVYVLNKGDLVLLIMADTEANDSGIANAIKENFENLK